MIGPMPVLICVLTGYILGSQLATSQSDGWEGAMAPLAPPRFLRLWYHTMYSDSMQ